MSSTDEFLVSFILLTTTPSRLDCTPLNSLSVTLINDDVNTFVKQSLNKLQGDSQRRIPQFVIPFGILLRMLSNELCEQFDQSTVCNQLLR